MVESVQQRRAEFNAHVWDHSADPFQAEFDTRRDLSVAELTVLLKAATLVADGGDDEQLAALLLAELGKQSSVLLAVMQISGLTRNKIITDLKASSAAAMIRVPGKPEGLLVNESAWRLAGPYLAAKLRKVLYPVAVQPPELLVSTLQALNQATHPGWIRQERAKRQGHEAEHRIATMLFNLGVPFEPEEKVDNPLCRDAQIAGISFDIVVPSISDPVVVLKSTVQTANIGQFGESKADLEVAEASAMLASRYTAPRSRPTLIAMIDGVGFHSNTAGLHGVLEKSDEFVQFSTIWKVAAVAAARLNLDLSVALPAIEIEAHADFIARWNRPFLRYLALERGQDVPPCSTVAVEAGEAWLLR